MYAGDGSDCKPCHAARVATQMQTSHAKALHPWSGEHFAGRTVRGRDDTTYSFTAEGVRLSRGEQHIDAPIRWAFGSGVQAVTPLLERDGRWVEHRLSWYREGNRLGLTPGHDPSPTLELNEALGIEQTARNAERCFGCHTTEGTPGVYCQSCHGDGEKHRRAPGRSNIARDRSVAVCARCHRSPDAQFTSATPELDDARSIRFAPVGFLASVCYRQSRGFTCVSCHDPHGETQKVNADAVCGGCHRAVHTSQCPRTPGCAGCHMKASSPMPGLRFTDHRIRVYAQ